MDVIGSEIQVIKRQYDNQYRYMCLASQIMYIAEKLAEMWKAEDGEDINVTINADSNWNPGITVIVYFEEKDSFKTERTEKFLEAFIDNYPELDDTLREDNYDEYKWRSWRRRMKKNTMVGITIKFYYGKSKSCRLVETGEVRVTPITKVICE